MELNNISVNLGFYTIKANSKFRVFKFTKDGVDSKHTHFQRIKRGGCQTKNEKLNWSSKWWYKIFSFFFGMHTPFQSRNLYHVQMQPTPSQVLMVLRIDVLHLFISFSRTLQKVHAFSHQNQLRTYQCDKL